MAKNSIGQFIATLRKANGMTQQEVADRLNVSNKAVSRWERDECSPDVTVIPALAEMFDVTCDELLKGERILESAKVEKKEQKVEKQVKSLVTKTLSGFKTMIWISLAIAVVGLICMFGISYGFYRPVIGFAVMLLFETCALVIAILAVSRTKDIKTDNELFEMAEECLVSRFNSTLGNLSFLAFYLILAVVLLSLPFIFVTSDYVDSVITPYSYFTIFFGGIVLILALVYFTCRRPYFVWITNGALPKPICGYVSAVRRKMSIIQVVMLVVASILFDIAPYFYDKIYVAEAVTLVGIACVLTNIITFFVFFIHKKTERTKLLIPGIRNILLIPSVLFVSKSHVYGYDYWDPEYLFLAFASAAVVFILFCLIELVSKKIRKN